MFRWAYVYGMLLLVLLSGCDGCNSEEPYTGNPNPLLHIHKVYGRVKTVETKYFEALPREGKLVPGSQIGESYTWDSFDVSGNLLVSKVFSLGGGLMKEEHFTYNPAGQMIAIVTLNGNGDATIHQDIYYNDKGQKTKQVVTLHLEEDQAYWRTWTYDSIGQLVESHVFRSDSVLDNRETLTYYPNDSGKVHVHTLFVGYDTLKYKNEYVYDGRGHDSILYRYRPLDNGTVDYQSRYEYTFDDNGNELTRNLLTPQGVLRATTAYEYMLDSHKNWIQRIEVVDNEPNVIKMRTFSYYGE